MAQKLKFGNGTWATKEGSTLAYNDENNNYKPLPFSFTRDSIATRVNKEGLIEVVGKDKPRIDYTDSADGVLLLEPSRTNFIINSENLNGSGWNVYGSSGGTVTRTSNYGISPSGELNSTRVVFSDVNTALYISTSANGEATASVYVKGVVGETIGFGFGASVASGDNFVFNGEWQRLEFTDTSINYALSINTWGGARDARDFEVYGAQMEAGSYATSYIPTSGSSVTRAAETANGAGNSEVFNDSEGVFMMDISALDNDSYRLISLSDGTNGNNVRINLTPTPNQIIFEANSGNSLQSAFTYNGVDVLLNNKIIIKYKQNDYSFWVNGFKVGTDTSGNTPIGLDRINFDRGTGGNVFYGKTKEIGYYDTALTDLELEYLTSYRSLNELVTELNLNTL